MQIARGSTFDFTISLPEEYDISDAKAIWVTFAQGNKEKLTMTLSSGLTVNRNKISGHLSQQETLSFYSGSAKMQTRILTAEDESLVQEPITSIEILDILKDGVISDG